MMYTSVSQKLLLLILLFAKDGTPVKIHRIKGPKIAKAGTEVLLTCEYETKQDESIRNIKWYKGVHEFYRYSPKDWQNPKKFFLPDGMNVNEWKCDEKSILLEELHSDMSGMYKCEVTIDDVYETIHKLFHLQVIDPPATPPQISGIPEKIPLNKWLKLQCHLPWMTVKPNLTFYVNSKKAKHKDELHIKRLTGRKQNKAHNQKLRIFEYEVTRPQDANHLHKGTTIVLEMKISRQHINSHGSVDIKCRALVADGVYDQETVLSVPVASISHHNAARRNNSQPSDIIMYTQLLLIATLVINLK